MPKPRVGIDLAPAGFTARAPGTARHVTGQARALFALDVPWNWVPVVDTATPPVTGLEHLAPVLLPGRKVWTRAVFQVGGVFRRKRCALGFATAYFAPMTGPPIISNFFDSNLYEYGANWVSSGKRWNYYLNRVLFRHSIQRSERLFVLSRYCADILGERFPKHRHKFIVNPCGVEKPSAEPRKPIWAESLQKPFCLYVGVFSDNKNQYRLIRAWAQLQRSTPDLPLLLLLGRCDEEYLRMRIQPGLQNCPRPHEVMLRSGVPDNELAWCYENALLYLQPSIAEGFGLPVAEAMGHGVPVACSQTTSLPEVAGDAAVYFDPFDLDSMGRSIKTLLTDPKLQCVLGEKGRARSSGFTWEKNADLVAKTIEELLSSQKNYIE